MDDLTSHEIQILREINGEMTPSPWGAWVGECLEALKEGDYITKKFGGQLTEKGRAALLLASLEREELKHGQA